MKSKLISFILALCLLIAIPVSALYKYNPFTRKLDYYEPVSGSDLGDLGDVTLTGLATGNVLYYNGTAWVNLATGANTNVLTLAGGVPTWAAPGAPAAHAASHEVGGADLVDHDQLTNYLAAQHLTLPNTLAAVLTDHNLAAHTALGLFDASADVDHNATTNYAANQHVVLPNTIANVLSDHNLAAHTAIGIPNPANVFYVSATGGDYTTIQAALTAQNAGGETFLVGPGTYTDTIHFSANDQVVKPLGYAANVIVTQADANIVEGGVHTDCIVEDIEIRLTAPTTAINAIQVGTGDLTIIRCRVYLATAVALVAADQPSLVGFTGAGTINLMRGIYEYYHTGNTGAGGIKAAFRANVNLADLHLHKVDQTIVTNSGTALATTLFVTVGTAVTEMHNNVMCTITDPNATSVVGMGYISGAGQHNIQGNHVEVIATNNISYGLYHGGTGTIRSSYNAIHASDAAGSSYAFFVGASATLNSHYDDLRSDDGNNIAGTFVQVSSPADGDLAITDELDVIGVSEFSGDTNQYEDVFITWADATDHASITQSAVAGIENQPLIYIEDERSGVTVDEVGEATLVLNADGPTYSFYIQDGHFYNAQTSYFAGDTYQYEDVFITWADAADHMRIIQGSATGIEAQALIYVQDDRIGATANEADEASLYIANESGDEWAFYADIGKVQWDGDVLWSWGSDSDNAVISQTAVAGIEDVPLINIADARTGATANEESEATIFMDSEGSYAFVVQDGYSVFNDRTYFSNKLDIINPGSMTVGDDRQVMWGGGQIQRFSYDTNGSEDAMFSWWTGNSAVVNNTNVIFVSNLFPIADAGHNDYLSPTFIITNDEGADANDYSGVLIGERAQSNVAIAHYFDFYALTGAADAAVDPNITEIAAIFRFGPNGTGVPSNATTPGDVLFEGSIEVDGNINIDGEVFQGDYVVSQVVNFDDGGPVEICSVADGYVVTDVYIEITTTWDGDGTIVIGDGATADGFLTDAGITQGAAAYYGQVHSARGAYLFAAAEEVDKIYTGADTVDATLTTTTSTQGVATVYVHITRLK